MICEPLARPLTRMTVQHLECFKELKLADVDTAGSFQPDIVTLIKFLLHNYVNYFVYLCKIQFVTPLSIPSLHFLLFVFVKEGTRSWSILHFSD